MVKTKTSTNIIIKADHAKNKNFTQIMKTEGNEETQKESKSSHKQQLSLNINNKLERNHTSRNLTVKEPNSRTNITTNHNTEKSIESNKSFSKMKTSKEPLKKVNSTGDKNEKKLNNYQTQSKFFFIILENLKISPLKKNSSVVKNNVVEVATNNNTIINKNIGNSNLASNFNILENNNLNTRKEEELNQKGDNLNENFKEKTGKKLLN